MAVRPKKQRVGRQGEEGEGREGSRKRKRRPGDSRAKLPKKRPGDEGYDPYDFTSSESEGEEPAPPTSESHDQEETMETGPAQMSTERSVIC